MDLSALAGRASSLGAKGPSNIVLKEATWKGIEVTSGLTYLGVPVEREMS